MLSSQIVVPDIKKHTYDTFDEFCELKNFINNEENKNVILMAQNENETLSFIAMKYRHIKNLPVPLDIEKYKIYIEERDSNEKLSKKQIMIILMKLLISIQKISLMM